MKKKQKGGGATGAAEDERRRTETKTASKTKEKCDGDEEAVVLRMELHCDGCALKVRKAIKGAQGAERVRTDVAAGTVTVAGNGNGNGKADPWDLRDRIQARMARRHIDIAFVSPPNPPRPPPKPKSKQQQQQWRPWRWSINNKKHDGDANNKGGNGRHYDKQMPPPSPESTVVLNIQLHCQGCTDRIRRKASNIQGVKQVTVDTAKDQVTVKGTMDAKALPDVLSAKLKRRVAAVVVPPMTNKKNKDKKQAAAGPNDHDDDNREWELEQGEEEAHGGGTAGGAKKKKKNWKKQRGEAAGDDEMASRMPPEEQQYPMTIFPASYGSVGSSYRAELLQGPQPFSDENPNACSLM